MKTQGFTDI